MAESAQLFTPISPAESDYQVSFDPCPKRVTVVFNGVTIADSEHAMVMRETRLAPVYYFPRADVRMDLMHRTRHHTYCPFRGSASYWTLKVGEQVAENAVWGYESPTDDAASVKDYVAFYQNRMDAVFEAEHAVASDAGDETSKHPNALVDWMVRDAWLAPTARELVTQFAKALNRAGVPVSRLWITVRTMHPQLMSTRYGWHEDTDEIDEVAVGFEVLEETRYLESPLKPIFDGAGGVRRRLDVPDPQRDYH